MADKHLLFVWKATGYELREGDGELPELGSVVEVEEGVRQEVNRVASSPLPGNDASPARPRTRRVTCAPCLTPRSTR